MGYGHPLSPPLLLFPTRPPRSASGRRKSLQALIDLCSLFPLPLLSLWFLSPNVLLLLEAVSCIHTPVHIGCRRRLPDCRSPRMHRRHSLLPSSQIGSFRRRHAMEMEMYHARHAPNEERSRGGSDKSSFLFIVFLAPYPACSSPNSSIERLNEREGANLACCHSHEKKMPQMKISASLLSSRIMTNHDRKGTSEFIFHF